MKKIYGLSITGILLLISIAFFALVFYDYLNISSTYGPYRISHWLAWIGTGFIALYTPIYAILKRKRPKQMKSLLTVHVYGNLLAFIPITMHFAQQISRPVQFYPDLGTGITLYPVVLLLVLTGIMQKYGLPKRFGKQKRFVHVAIAFSFYLIIVTHILQGLQVL